MKPLRSKVLRVDIGRPTAEVYGFVADPLNFPLWAAVTGPMTQVGPLDWKAQTAFGERFVRFSPRNDFGCLDHAIFAAGEAPIFLPMWVIPNEEGATLLFVFPQRPLVTDEAYELALQWIETDLLTLQSLLETDTALLR